MVLLMSSFRLLGPGGGGSWAFIFLAMGSLIQLCNAQAALTEDIKSLLSDFNSRLTTIESSVLDIKQELGLAVNTEELGEVVSGNSESGVLIGKKTNLGIIKEELRRISEAVIKESTQLIYYPNEISALNGQQVTLDCGVVGEYHSCHWKHGDMIYQLDEVSNGFHSSLAEGNNSKCGISITSTTGRDAGIWTCNILTSEHTLSTSKTLSVKLPDGFEDFNGRIVRVTQKSDGEMYFQESLDRCTSLSPGGKPFVPRTQQDYDFMARVKKEKLSSANMWFPITDIENEGQLKWTDNTDAAGSGIIGWYEGQELVDNNYSRNCGRMGRSGVLMNSCTENLYPMICEL